MQGAPGGVKGEKGEPGEPGKRVSVMTISSIYKNSKYAHIYQVFSFGSPTTSEIMTWKLIKYECSA